MYVASPYMNLLKVHILNPIKIMQRMVFVQASRLNGQNIVETNCDMSLLSSKFKHRSIGLFLLIWNKT